MSSFFFFIPDYSGAAWHNLLLKKEKNKSSRSPETASLALCFTANDGRFIGAYTLTSFSVFSSLSSPVMLAAFSHTTPADFPPSASLCVEDQACLLGKPQQREDVR